MSISVLDSPTLIAMCRGGQMRLVTTLLSYVTHLTWLYRFSNLYNSLLPFQYGGVRQCLSSWVKQFIYDDWQPWIFFFNFRLLRLNLSLRCLEFLRRLKVSMPPSPKISISSSSSPSPSSKSSSTPGIPYSTSCSSNSSSSLGISKGYLSANQDTGHIVLKAWHFYQTKQTLNASMYKLWLQRHF